MGSSARFSTMGIMASTSSGLWSWSSRQHDPSMRLSGSIETLYAQLYLTVPHNTCSWHPMTSSSFTSTGWSNHVLRVPATSEMSRRNYFTSGSIYLNWVVTFSFTYLWRSSTKWPVTAPTLPSSHRFSLAHRPGDTLEWYSRTRVWLFRKSCDVTSSLGVWQVAEFVTAFYDFSLRYSQALPISELHATINCVKRISISAFCIVLGHLYWA